MNTFWKKLVSGFLTVMMLISVFPMTAFADTAETEWNDAAYAEAVTPEETSVFEADGQASDPLGTVQMETACKFVLQPEKTVEHVHEETVTGEDGEEITEHHVHTEQFTCGVFNKSDENLGKTFKVELIIWNPADPDTKYVIATTTYTFEKPELPEANVDPITPATVEIEGEGNVVLEAEYEFTPVEPTEAQLAYYGSWYADYRVSMDDDTAAESFGLYGEYDGYGQHFAQGFLFPNAMTADVPVQLLEMLDLTGVTYNDVVKHRSAWKKLSGNP